MPEALPSVETLSPPHDLPFTEPLQDGSSIVHNQQDPSYHNDDNQQQRQLRLHPYGLECSSGGGNHCETCGKFVRK